MCYGMTDTFATLNEHVKKAEAKVARYGKSLETAKKELADLHTTLRVMASISGESSTFESAATTTSTTSRQQEIADLLGVGRENGHSPMDLFEAYNNEGADDINIDTFRTTIWRMKGKTYTCNGQAFIIQSGNGEYWKEPVPLKQQSENQVFDL